MNTKYYANGFGVTFYFDEAIDSNRLGETKFKKFQEELDKLEGVETVTYKRYSIDVTYGIMFGPRLMLNRTVRFIQNYFGIEVGEPVDVAATAERGLTQEYYKFEGAHDA